MKLRFSSHLYTLGPVLPVDRAKVNVGTRMVRSRPDGTSGTLLPRTALTVWQRRPVPTAPFASHTRHCRLPTLCASLVCLAQGSIVSDNETKVLFDVGRQVLCSHKLHAENVQRRIPDPAWSDPTVDFLFGQHRATPNPVNDATTQTLTFNHGRDTQARLSEHKTKPLKSSICCDG
jgi:hypothetical protein